MLDARNYPIEVGDIVAYPGRKGSGCWLTPSIVTALREGAIQVQPVDPRTDMALNAEKPRWIRCLDNVVRLHRPLSVGRA